ncbi:MAG: VWA domain-containing protein [Bdellovibrionales bacterium]|nr:VWA domain-containing protein [Bdellovibrionales bacterium]
MLTLNRTITLGVVSLLSSLVFCTLNLYAAGEADQVNSQRSKAIVVLDASGSMWGQIEGKTKIEIARDVVGDFLDNLSPNLDLGLVAYGHRKKGDCDDIESLIEPSPVNKTNFQATVNQIKPKGMTPLSASVIKAAEKLKFTEDKATVILVSDGIETCDFDPCEVGKSLEEQGVDFTAHVIGFGVSKDDEEQLRCLAEATGGEYRTANDAGSLKDALGSAATQAAVIPDFNLILRAKQLGTDELISGAINWQILSDNKIVAEKNGTVARLNLNPGSYQVKASWGKLSAETKAEVVTTEVTEKEVEFSGSFITMRGLKEINGPEVSGSVSWSVYDTNADAKQGKKVLVTAASNKEFVLPAGEYIVNGRYGNSEEEKSVNLIAGDKQVVELIFNVGRVNLYGLREENGEKLADSISWHVYKRETNGEKGRQVIAAGGPEKELSIPAGDYIVTARLDRVELDKPVSILSGENTELAFLFAAGEIKLSGVRYQDGPEITESIAWKVYGKDANGEFTKHVASAGGTNREFTIPPGEYLVEGLYGNARVSKEFQVEANKTTNAVLAFDAGKLIAKAYYSEGGRQILDSISWNVLQPSDGFNDPKSFAYGGGSEKEFKLPAGEYILRVKHKSALVEQNVKVEAGKKTEVSVNLNAGKVKLTGIMAGGKEISDRIAWTIYNNSTGKQTDFGASDGPREFVLSAGEYKVSAKYGYVETEAIINVEADKLVDEKIEFNASKLKMTTVSEPGVPSGKRVFWYVFEDLGEEKGRQITSLSGASKDLVLPEGSYIIEAKPNQGEVLSENIKLSSGESKELEMLIQ